MRKSYAMNMRTGRFIATFLIALAAIAATPKPAKPKPAPLTPEQRAAQALMKSMSLRDKVAQLVIVVANLLRNAVDSMTKAGIISLRGTYVDGRVLIEVEDQGTGISTEDVHRVFEPFFSTKSRGMGLGLAISRAIIENHRGKIRVTSAEGKGTCFTISLPAFHQDTK